MNKKITIWLIIIIASIALIVFLAYFLFNIGKKKNSENQININTNQGQVAINDIYQDVFLGTEKDKILFSDNNYNITYNRECYQEDSAGRAVNYDCFYFAINITNGDLQKMRGEAENKLLGLLGIKENEFCKLNISTTDLISGSATFGKELGISFCEK